MSSLFSVVGVTDAWMCMCVHVCACSVTAGTSSSSGGGDVLLSSGSALAAAKSGGSTRVWSDVGIAAHVVELVLHGATIHAS
jgi:hypothetical protein